METFKIALARMMDVEILINSIECTIKHELFAFVRSSRSSFRMADNCFQNRQRQGVLTNGGVSAWSLYGNKERI